MVRWFAAVSAAVAVTAAAATASEEGEAQHGAPADSDRPQRWQGRVLVEPEGDHVEETPWDLSDGSQGEDGELAANITPPSGWRADRSSNGATPAGSTRDGEDDVVGEDGSVGDGDTAPVSDTDTSPDSIASGSSSDSGQDMSEDASSEAVDAEEDVTAAPTSTDVTSEWPVVLTPPVTLDSTAIPSSSPDVDDGDEVFNPEDPSDSTASSSATGTDSAASSPNEEPTDPSAESSERDANTVEPTDASNAPGPVDGPAASVSASASGAQAESTPAHEVEASEVTAPSDVTTAAPFTSAPSASPVVETPTDVPTVDEREEDTPSPSTVGVDPVEEPDTATPPTSDAEMHGDAVDAEAPTTNLTTAAPTTTDVSPASDSLVSEDTHDDHTADAITASPIHDPASDAHEPKDEPTPEMPVEATAAPIMSATPVSEAEPASPTVDPRQDAMDTSRTVDAPPATVVAVDSPAPGGNTDSGASLPGSSGYTDHFDSDPAVPVASTEVPKPSQDVDTEHEEPASTIDEPSTDVAGESPGTAHEEDPVKEASNGGVEELPVVTETPHTVALDTLVVIDSQPPVRATEAPAANEDDVPKPATIVEEIPSGGDEESPDNAVGEGPVKETPSSGGVEEPPGATEIPHGVVVETPGVVISDNTVNSDAGSKVSVYADAPKDTATLINEGHKEDEEGTAENANGHAKEGKDDDKKKEEGGNAPTDDTTAAADSGEATALEATSTIDTEGPSTPTSRSDPDPVELVSSEASTPPVVASDLPSPLGLSTGNAITLDATNEITTVIAEDEPVSDVILGLVHSPVVDTAGTDVDAVLPMATTSGDVDLTIPEASSGSKERASLDPDSLRVETTTTRTPTPTLDVDPSRSRAEADETDGLLSTASPASVTFVHATASASSGSRTASTLTNKKAVSSAHTSASSLVTTSGLANEGPTKAAESDEPKATLSADLLAVDTSSTATKLSAASTTVTVAELTGSGALILADGTNAQSYVRGQTSIDSGLVAAGSEQGALLSGASGAANDGEAHIIGGRKSRVGSMSSGLYVSSSMFQNVVRYTASVASVLSVALLVGFHFVYLDDRLRWPTHSPGTYWSPNAWEFVVYAGYLQQTMALSPMTLMQTPYFLWEFTDIFAWSNLLVYKNPSPKSSGGRRLDIIILNSLVGYADRIGADEASLIYRVDAGFAVVFFVVLALAAVLYGVDNWRNTAKNSVSDDHKPHASDARRLLGLCVLLWFFSLFPLTLVGSFEVAMEVQASMYSSGPLVLSMVAVVAISAGGLAVAARSILHTSSSELRQPKTRALWGALYLDHKHPARLFFVFTAALQIVTGLAIGAMRASKTLLVLLLVIHGTYLLALFACAPFATRAALAQRFAYATTAAKMLNVVMAFAFLETVPLSVDARCRVARAFIGMNALILVAWFLRHLVLFCTCVVVMSSRDGDADAGDVQRPSEDEGARPDIVRLECGGGRSSPIQVSYGRASVAGSSTNAAVFYELGRTPQRATSGAGSGSETTRWHCDWQGSTTPTTAIL